MAAKASSQIGRRLLQARTKRELTMAELADKAGLSASSVNQIEKGRHSPSAETIESFAKALKVDPCWLAYGTGTKPDWLTKKDGAGESGSYEPGR